MNTTLKAAELLETAAEALETRGWCQGEFVDPAGRHCALGAIDLARQTMRAGVPILFVARAALREAIPRDIVAWNDSLGRRAHEVIDAMKLAAKDLRNGAVAE